ncbi:MAG: FtsQ-type POTRA domain-containing protein [Gammaproteobacteria bacterium]|nr:MAG: FtsQ-type POTRA domain-containing protein [Gammaproteobacteria bacterium]
MKNRPPVNDRPAVSDRLVGANRLFERDVLLQDEPRREPRVRASIIGDKKLTARDVPVARKESKAESRNENRLLGRRLIAKDTPPPEKRSRVVFDDPILPRTDSNLRRERGYTKVSPQGGNNKTSQSNKKSAVEEVRSSVSRKIIYRGVGLGLLLVTFAVAAYFVADPLAHLLERPLKSVAVEGQFQYLPKDRAMELIEKEIDGDFLQLNLTRLKNVLQQDPWVDNVYLSRRWPDTLVVKIAEQTPIARWDANGFLNQRGEIIRVQETNKLLGLPWLQGNEINAREIMQQYQDLSTLLRSRGLEIVALKCDNKKSWRLTLKNDKEIAIGREEVMEKLRRFVTVYDKFLSSVWTDVKAIDVRYSNGVSVQWIPDSEMAKKYLKPDVSAQQNHPKK